MPLSPDEQRILDEIEERLAEEDPRLAETVSRTSLSAHLSSRIRWSLLAFFGGFVMLMLFPIELWLAAVGFGVMLASALLIYRYLKQLTREQVRAMQQSGRFSITAMLARMSERFRGPQRPGES
jgi:ABC-type bacteriocin/lantibiotic exporter with double-glycine peptidase domain